MKAYSLVSTCFAKFFWYFVRHNVHNVLFVFFLDILLRILTG